MTVDPADVGRRFVRALAAKDRDGMTAVFAPDVHFWGLTPGSAHAAGSPAEVADVLLGGPWFDDDDRVRETLELQVDRVSDRHRVHYRFLVDSRDEVRLVEQHGYYDVEDGRIARMSLVCAGFRPFEGEAG